MPASDAIHDIHCLGWKPKKHRRFLLQALKRSTTEWAATKKSKCRLPSKKQPLPSPKQKST